MGIILLIAVLIGVFFLVQWIVKSSPKRESGQSAPGESALEILRQRYAKGEISKEEFEEKKKYLEK
jgi:putative membrane protein